MKLMKKVLAFAMAAAMVLGISVTTLALENAEATITIEHAGENARFNSVQIVVADPTTETGWNIVDEYADEFTDAFGAVDEQVILNGMIYAATDGNAGIEIDGFDSKYAAALDAICATVDAPTAETGSASPLTVNSAGVYVIRGFEENYTYGTMAAYIAFGPYDTTTGAPTDLVDTTIQAKRTPTKTEKDSDDPDKVVEIGRTVEFTVTSTVPYIAPTELVNAEYWFNDTLTGGEYVTDAEGQVSVMVTTNGGFNKTFEATVENGGIHVDLSEILANNAYANDTITITYSATVTDTIMTNDASTGKTENDPSFGSDSETLYTGEIELIKLDEDKVTKLAGAKFVMYKGEGEAVEYALVDENGKLTGWTANKEEASELVTDENGNIKVEGLDLGTYYFEEVEAPEGYSLDADPVSVMLKLGEDETTASAIVTADPATKLNTKLSALPATGGIGTTIFTISGCVIMIVAASLFFVSRRKTESK